MCSMFTVQTLQQESRALLPSLLPAPRITHLSKAQGNQVCSFPASQNIDNKYKHETMKTENASFSACTANMHENTPCHPCMQFQYLSSEQTLTFCFCFKLVWLVAKSNMFIWKKKINIQSIFKYVGSNKSFFFLENLRSAYKQH